MFRSERESERERERASKIFKLRFAKINVKHVVDKTDDVVSEKRKH